MRSYLLVLLRNLIREKLYSAINIGGLALGLASCLILGMFLKSELTYDRHFRGHENVYRVVEESTSLGHTQSTAITSAALGPLFAAEYPDVVRNYARLRNNAPDSGLAMRRADQPEQVYYWDRSYFADPDVFEVFPVDVIAGDPKTALLEENTLAISASVARKYFGSANPIGQVLLTEANTARRITLVFADLPPNTHLKFDLLHAMDMGTRRVAASIGRSGMVSLNDPVWRTYTYVRLVPGSSPADWGRMSQSVYRKYMAGRILAPKAWRSWLQPLRHVHMQSEVAYDLPNGNRAFVFGYAAVAMIILVIACINYMNLATARAARRARSVGFRKILGASRMSLAWQFLGEALLFSVIALVLAAAIAEVAIRFTSINVLMNGEALLNLRDDPQLALWLLAAALFVGLLSGLYPALYLSSWAPLSALMGRQAASTGNLRMREALVLVQFTISTATIAFTLLMVGQMHYLATRPLGFDRDNRLMVMVRGAATIDKIPEIRDALLLNSSIRGVTTVDQTPDAGPEDEGGIFEVETNDGGFRSERFKSLSVGDNYERVMGMKIVEGRGLSGPNAMEFVVNEALVRKMGWVHPVGKRFRILQVAPPGRVVGVVADFNFRSLRHLVEPVVLYRLSAPPPVANPVLALYQKRFLIVDITDADTSKVLDSIGRVMTAADPVHPFSYRFLDEALNAQYEADLSLQKLVGFFSGISIFIAGMGLFGLAAFTTEQRSREIGTRKVLGASAWQIVGLLSRRMLILVLAASVIACVLAYVAIQFWLSGFAYRAAINPLVFAGSALAAAAVAFVTVAAQSWRIANADPAVMLRRM